LIGYIDCDRYPPGSECMNRLPSSGQDDRVNLMDLTKEINFPFFNHVAKCDIAEIHIPKNMDGVKLKLPYNPKDPREPVKCKVCDVITGEIEFLDESECKIGEEAEFSLTNPDSNKNRIIFDESNGKFYAGVVLYGDLDEINKIKRLEYEKAQKLLEESKALKGRATIGVLIFLIVSFTLISYFKKFKQKKVRIEEERNRKEQERIREKERLQTEKRRNENEKFEKSQKAKGLVRYNEKWGTPKEVEKWKEENYKKSFPYLVQKEIKSFTPSKKWNTEEGYQGELQGWIKTKFPHSKVEIQRGSSRPDLLIGKIAVEVKGPTGSNELSTIADKCMRYALHFEHLIIVLFDLRVSHHMYEEWLDALKRQHPKVVVIKK